VPKILISDYDGTITRSDFYSLLAERYIPADAPDYFAQYRAGLITHFQAMAAYFAYAPTAEAALEELLEATAPDPDLADAAGRLEEAGWELIVVSAGTSWYIERVFARAGVRASVYSNPGRIVPGKGLVIEKLAASSPFYSEDVGVDKAAVVRDALRRAEVVAFAGDGPPDIHPALLVQPQFRFARGFLADELRARGEAFRPFNRWSEVVEGLT
jgi:2-hydroxy-3-keto-5-methylthiopentenyl-1-phosphate phosphatase